MKPSANHPQQFPKTFQHQGLMTMVGNFVFMIRLVVDKRRLRGRAG